MKTNRKTIVMLAVVLIACMCICMATKEGLDTEDPCSWFVLMDSYDPDKKYNCDKCPSGKELTKRKKTLGEIEIMEFTCGEKA